MLRGSVATTVTLLIRYTRGRIAVLDRPGLEQQVCECYEVVQRECRRLLPSPFEPFSVDTDDWSFSSAR